MPAPPTRPSSCRRTSVPTSTARGTAARPGRKSSTGLPDTAFARVVREDPVRKGLLFCGTESAVYVSFDAGDHWQSLQLNLPASSMRDLWVHGDDLVLGTYGRSLWILDDITPLRQLATGAPSDRRQAVRTGAGDSRAVGRERRHAAAGRSARGAKSAGRRDHRLLAAGGSRRRDHADDHRRARQRGAHVHVHRAARIDAAAERAGLLVCPAVGAHEEPRAESLRLESSLSESEDPAVRLLRRAAGVRRVHARRPRHPRPDATRPARGTARRCPAGTRSSCRPAARAIARRSSSSPIHACGHPRPISTRSSSSRHASPTRWR